MKPEDRIHRVARGAPMSAADRPPMLLSHLGKGVRVALVCGACTWSKSYDPHRLIARLAEKGAGGPAPAIARVARHVHWPCPACGRMAWATQPDWAGRGPPPAVAPRRGR